ncbi:hypothetical protein GALMADRAFT_1353428 [Galerina marginata CBS 339.88]|uniref:Uncharacterized protein n=1 Tax=Galerina marginata (strain CBS 339.88) TaxID=685588 RepID=A0A067SDI4_GALM3|nr:hypothetical protein GALMADRAFT_1353428 [Galerina marginata CBS 339.88]
MFWFSLRSLLGSSAAGAVLAVHPVSIQVGLGRGFDIRLDYSKKFADTPAIVISTSRTDVEVAIESELQNDAPPASGNLLSNPYPKLDDGDKMRSQPNGGVSLKFFNGVKNGIRPTSRRQHIESIGETDLKVPVMISRVNGSTRRELTAKKEIHRHIDVKCGEEPMVVFRLLVPTRSFSSDHRSNVRLPDTNCDIDEHE